VWNGSAASMPSPTLVRQKAPRLPRPSKHAWSRTKASGDGGLCCLGGL
jgi:hypothetical protein